MASTARISSRQQQVDLHSPSVLSFSSASSPSTSLSSSSPSSSSSSSSSSSLSSSSSISSSPTPAPAYPALTLTEHRLSVSPPSPPDAREKCDAGAGGNVPQLPVPPTSPPPAISPILDGMGRSLGRTTLQRSDVCFSLPSSSASYVLRSAQRPSRKSSDRLGASCGTGAPIFKEHPNPRVASAGSDVSCSPLSPPSLPSLCQEISSPATSLATLQEVSTPIGGSGRTHPESPSTIISSSTSSGRKKAAATVDEEECTNVLIMQKIFPQFDLNHVRAKVWRQARKRTFSRSERTHDQCRTLPFSAEPQRSSPCQPMARHHPLRLTTIREQPEPTHSDLENAVRLVRADSTCAWAEELADWKGVVLQAQLTISACEHAEEGRAALVSPFGGTDEFMQADEQRAPVDSDGYSGSDEDGHSCGTPSAATDDVPGFTSRNLYVALPLQLVPEAKPLSAITTVRNLSRKASDHHHHRRRLASSASGSIAGEGASASCGMKHPSLLPDRLRRNMLTLLDTASEMLQCKRVILVVDRAMPGFEAVLHALCYVGGHVVGHGPPLRRQEESPCAHRPPRPGTGTGTRTEAEAGTGAGNGRDDERRPRAPGPMVTSDTLRVCPHVPRTTAITDTATDTSENGVTTADRMSAAESEGDVSGSCSWLGWSSEEAEDSTSPASDSPIGGGRWGGNGRSPSMLHGVRGLVPAPGLVLVAVDLD